MPVSIALSDKEYHHSPCMECQFIPRLPSGTSSGFPDNFPVLLDGEIHCEYTAQWPGQATNPDFSTWSLAHLLWDRPPQLLSRGGSNIPNRVFLRFPEEGSWGISSGQRCFLPRLLSLPTFQTIYLQAWVTFCPAFWKFWRWSERLSRDSIWRPNQNSRADNPQYLVPNGHDHVSVWYSKMQP